MAAETFDSNDKAYLAWIRDHPNGFVINTPRNRSTDYMLLHRATCYSIARYHPRANVGGFTERDYVKICADDVRSLQVWVRQNGREDGSFSSECGMCQPH
jgi:5-methylcytosine-specific restriction protein A